MRIGIFYIFVLPFFILFSCKTTGKLHSNSYGGSFKINKQPEIFQADDNIADSTSTYIEPILLLKSEPAQNVWHQTDNNSLNASVSTAEIQKAKVQQTDSTPDPALTEKPMEPNSNRGFWMVMGSMGLRWIASIALSVITFNATSTASIGIISLFAATLSIVCSLALVAGIVFAAIGLGIHKRNPGKYRGRGKALAAIIVPSILLILAVAIIALVILAGGFF